MESKDKISTGREQSLSRKELLKKAAVGLAAFAGLVVTSKVAKANTGDGLAMGGSGNTGNPNLAEDATEVQYDGGGPPLGVVFLAQADNVWRPSDAGVPAALAGWTTTNPNIPAGVYGYSARPNGYGVVGWNTSGPGSYGGYFGGDVYVTGNLSVGGIKNAIVPHPDGSHRRVYSMESPESWFEDFGDGVLEDGQADVRFNPDFTAIVHNDAYQVFLTEYGESEGLYISSRSAAGFTVRERNGGRSKIAFGYRTVARRKDVLGPRLEKVTLPPLPTQGQVAGKPTNR
jgi:hypothetical protein